MIDFDFNPKASLTGATELRSRLAAQGGCVVAFQSIYSFLFVSVTRTKLVYLPRGQNRLAQGLLRCLGPLLFGWWSVNGLITTPFVIAHNLLGGFDFTATILDPATTDGKIEWETKDRGRAFQQQRFALGIGGLVVGFIIGLPLLFFLVDSIMKSLAKT